MNRREKMFLFLNKKEERKEKKRVMYILRCFENRNKIVFLLFLLPVGIYSKKKEEAKLISESSNASLRF